MISGGDNPYDVHDAKLSSSATTHESSSMTAHEINNSIIAASLMIMIPELVFYVILQKYIISGMTAGAVKG